jgi:hypothetical protein
VEAQRHTPVFADTAALSHLALCLGLTVIAAAVSTRPSRPEVRLSRTRGSTRHLPLAPQCRPGASCLANAGSGASPVFNVVSVVVFLSHDALILFTP